MSAFSATDSAHMARALKLAARGRYAAHPNPMVGCVLVRNGVRFTGRESRRYLESKRRRNAHLIDSAEAFIDKIASRSVTSGQPYLIKCRNQPRQNAGEWFAALLAERRVQ